MIRYGQNPIIFLINNGGYALTGQPGVVVHELLEQSYACSLRQGHAQLSLSYGGVGLLFISLLQRRAQVGLPRVMLWVTTQRALHPMAAPDCLIVGVVSCDARRIRHSVAKQYHIILAGTPLKSRYTMGPTMSSRTGCVNHSKHTLCASDSQNCDLGTVIMA